MTAPVTSPTAIRTDLVARLLSKTAAGARVYDSRRIDIQTDEIPCVIVTSAGGQETRLGMRSLMTRRTERVQVTGFVSGADDAALAAAVDTMEAAILDALLSDAEWLGAFKDVSKVAVEKTLDVDSRKRAGAVAIGFDLEYDMEHTPVAALANLATVRVTTDSTEPAGADVSSRDIAITVGA
jgi:hypothetical protein